MQNVRKSTNFEGSKDLHYQGSKFRDFFLSVTCERSKDHCPMNVFSGQVNGVTSFLFSK